MENNELLQKIEILEKKMADMEASRGPRAFLRRALSKTSVLAGVVIAAILTGIILYAAQITFTDGTVISAADVNNNFNDLYQSSQKIRELQVTTNAVSIANAASQVQTEFGSDYRIATAAEAIAILSLYTHSTLPRNTGLRVASDWGDVTGHTLYATNVTNNPTTSSGYYFAIEVSNTGIPDLEARDDTFPLRVLAIKKY